MNSKSNYSSSKKRLLVSSTRGLIAVVVILLFYWLVNGKVDRVDPRSLDPLFHPVEFGSFVYKLVEPGEIESSKNVDVICDVKSRNSYGTVILEIVPEGTWVDRGDFICKLDDSELQNQLLKEQIVVNDAEMKFIQSEADLENAKLALNEYESGTYLQEVKQHESDVFVSRENLRRSEEFLDFSVKLAARDYISEVQLEADRFAVEKARKELEVAETKLDVLQTLTRKKKLIELQAKLTSADVDLKSRQTILGLANKKLSEIKLQIENCNILAPNSGQVVYANRNGKYSEQVLIEEGRPVREKQIIARLPDPSKMRVLAKVNESRVDRLSLGQKATIKLDAFARMTLQGRVTEISEYPLPPRHYLMSHIKEYAATIEIIDPPAELRPGMTSEVTIVAEQLSDVLQVPIQGVLEKDKGFYCLVGNSLSSLEARPVMLGSSNEQFVVIEAGLESGIQVAMNPRQYEEKVEFPPYPSEYVRSKKRSDSGKKKSQPPDNVEPVTLLKKEKVKKNSE